MTLPSISIVTPSYNQGQYLEQTIQSVLDQNYPNLQYIIIDGGSTDNSVEVIKKYEKHLSYWISEKDKGQTHALNKGVARSTGDVFGYINSDDLLYPRSLQRIADTWAQGATWMCGWSMYLEMQGSDWPYMVRAIDRKSDWFLDNPIPQQSSFWSRKFFDEIGLFREDLHYCFDYEYWMRIRFKLELKPEIIRQCMSAFRLHDASKTVTVWDKFQGEFDAIHLDYRKYLSTKEKFYWWTGARRLRAVESRKVMWRARKENDMQLARKEAVKAIQQQPWSLDSWMSLYHSLRAP